VLADDRADNVDRVDAVGICRPPDLGAQLAVALQKSIDLAVFRLEAGPAGLRALGRSAGNARLLDVPVASRNQGLRPSLNRADAQRQNQRNRKTG
jgi:hypothetical protein